MRVAINVTLHNNVYCIIIQLIFLFTGDSPEQYTTSKSCVD